MALLIAYSKPNIVFHLLFHFENPSKPGVTNDVLTYIALLVIAIGTGGIKPCVSSLGGDQFADNEVGREQVAGFFSLFYASINAGSLLSTFISPILREEVECFDREDCFFIAFLIPAILMFVAILAFLFGKSYYVTNKPSGNIFVSFCEATWAGLRGKCKSDEPKEHFLDYAVDAGHDPGVVQDIKIRAQNIFKYPSVQGALVFDQHTDRALLFYGPL